MWEFFFVQQDFKFSKKIQKKPVALQHQQQTYNQDKHGGLPNGNSGKMSERIIEKKIFITISPLKIDE